MKHELYKNGDSNIPKSIQDEHGDAVLDMCKVCGKGEADLSEGCIQKGYYLPLISEFHAGFRYELEKETTLYTAGQEPIVNTEWTKAVTSMEYPEPTLPMIATLIEFGKIRVKSLAHDDIKEAGWEESKTSFSPGRQYYNLGDYECFLENGIVYIYREWADDGQNLFVGSIKNYNKLLEVMDMIGVEIK